MMTHNEQLIAAGFNFNDFTNRWFHQGAQVFVECYYFDGAERFDAISHLAQRSGRADTLRGAIHCLISEIRESRESARFRGQVKALRGILAKLEA